MRHLPKPSAADKYRDMAGSCAAGVIEHAREVGLLPTESEAVADLRKRLRLRIEVAIAEAFTPPQTAPPVAANADLVADQDTHTAQDVAEFITNTLAETRKRLGKQATE